MHQSSERIGAIAAALAKAQAELTNPEKTLTATSDRLFRERKIGRSATRHLPAVLMWCGRH
jgi:hypothetical protein